MKTTGGVNETRTEAEIARMNTPPSEQDMAAFDAAVAKWRGTATERMNELGFDSTEDFINAIRGR